MRFLKGAALTVGLFSTAAFGGGRDFNNGGNYVKSRFQRDGEEIVRFFNQYKEGRDLATSLKLDMTRFALTLEEENVLISAAPLYDKLNSKVDAIVTDTYTFPGVRQIVLDEAAWIARIEAGENLYALILHEMLRSTDIDDDQFILSRPIAKVMDAYLSQRFDKPDRKSVLVMRLTCEAKLSTSQIRGADGVFVDGYQHFRIGGKDLTGVLSTADGDASIYLFPSATDLKSQWKARPAGPGLVAVSYLGGPEAIVEQGTIHFSMMKDGKDASVNCHMRVRLAMN